VFRNAKARNRLFTEDHVWTFTIYQSQVDLASYSLDVGLRFDLTNHLDGQPLQFMMKDRSASHCCHADFSVSFGYLGCEGAFTAWISPITWTGSPCTS